jgi:hypothetical protein
LCIEELFRKQGVTILLWCLVLNVVVHGQDHYVSSSAGEIKKAAMIFGAFITVHVKDFSLERSRIFCLLQ